MRKPLEVSRKRSRMGQHDVGMPRDDEITSEELDGLLDEAETLHVAHAAEATQVRLYVAVDPDTLQELEQRAAALGTAWSLYAVAKRPSVCSGRTPGRCSAKMRW